MRPRMHQVTPFSVALVCERLDVMEHFEEPAGPPAEVWRKVWALRNGSAEVWLQLLEEIVEMHKSYFLNLEC